MLSRFSRIAINKAPLIRPAIQPFSTAAFKVRIVENPIKTNLDALKQILPPQKKMI